jgi:hypothetical protein
MTLRRDPDDPELVLEKAANRRYMQLLATSRIAVDGIAVSRSSIWLGTGLPHPQDVEVHPFVGRVALDVLDPAIGQHDFYIGPWHKESGDLVVFSWAAPVAAAFFHPDIEDHEFCGHVTVTRTMTVAGDDVVGFVDDHVRLSGDAQPFAPKRPLQVPRPPVQPSSPVARPAEPKSIRPDPHTQIDRASPPRPDPAPAASTTVPTPPVTTSAPPPSVGPTTPARVAARPATPDLRAEAAVRAAISSPRTARLTSTLATLQPDQYDLVTYPPDRPLVLQGNPGTGKTVIAAHRAAYLVNPARLGHLRRVLLVGPTTKYRDHVRDVVDELASSRAVKVEGLTDFLTQLRRLKQPVGGALEGHYLDFDSELADMADMAADTLDRHDASYRPLPGPDRIKAIYDALRANRAAAETIAYEADIAHRLLSMPPFESAARERRYVPVLAACALSAGVWKDDWFDHIIVDEAQDVRPLEWRVLQRLNTGGGWTIMGDVYQRRWDHSYRDWDSVIQHLELTDSGVPATSKVVGRGYRSTKQIMRFANQLLPAEGRRTESLQDDGPAVTVVLATARTLGEKTVSQATRLRAAYPAGTIAVIAPSPSIIEQYLRTHGWTREPDDLRIWVAGQHRVALLGSEESRGLEFDGVVVVEPAGFPANLGIRGQLYTSLTRANRELAVVHSQPLPDRMRARP